MSRDAPPVSQQCHRAKAIRLILCVWWLGRCGHCIVDAEQTGLTKKPASQYLQIPECFPVSSKQLIGIWELHAVAGYKIVLGSVARPLVHMVSPLKKQQDQFSALMDSVSWGRLSTRTSFHLASSFISLHVPMCLDSSHVMKVKLWENG